MDKILIVEDDRDIAGLVEIHMKDLGFGTEVCSDGLCGLDKALEGGHSMVILDIMLPGLDGLEICKRMRQEKIQSPVLMLTAKSEELDKVLGLEIGADDYLTKPFSVRELVARVKAIIRRTDAKAAPLDAAEGRIIEAADFFLDTSKRVVKVYGEKKELSPKEFDLLVMLSEQDGRTFSRQQLLSKVWGYEFDGFEHTVNSHINRIRNKIERDAQTPQFILTTWGVGYRFRDLSEL